MKYLLALGFLFGALNSYAAVWTATNRWNDQWEDKYKQWVEREWRADIFTNANARVYSLDRARSINMADHATDCADASYLMRGIFAYLHSLEFKVKMDYAPDNPRSFISSSSSNDACGFSSFCWNRISNPDQKFKTFMKYVQTMRTNTTTLAHDTYSPVLNSRGVHSGNSCLLYQYHSYQISSISSSGVPTKTNSTVPYMVRDLAVSSGWCDHSNQQRPNGGIRKWRSPENLYASKASLIAAGLYSEDQFSKSSSEISNLIRTGAAESLSSRDQRMLNDLRSFFQERVQVVRDAARFCIDQRNDCDRNSNYANWDNWSTPSRDGRLLHMIKEWIKVRNQNGSARSVRSELSSIEVEYRPGRYTSLYDFFLVLNRGDESVALNLSESENKERVKYYAPEVTEPENSIDTRWGI